MVRGRKRKHDPTIPAHIDQAKLPAGCYWDRRDRVWYVILTDGPKAKRRRIAGADAVMSDLHRALEMIHGVDRRTLGWLIDQYLASPTYAALASKTRSSYRASGDIARELPTKLGKPLGALEFSRLETHHFQRIGDNLAAEGTPAKANHLIRFLKLVYSWAVRRGHATANPVKGVAQAKERKQRRLPTPEAMAKIIQLAHAGAQRTARSEGSLPPYLWAVADIAYLCRLRGIEVVTLTDEAATPDGLLTNRRKGSRDNIVAWTPRLRAAWNYLIDHRASALARSKRPVPIRPKDRAVVVSDDGVPLKKSALDSAWQRLMRRAIAAGVITESERFGLHDLKRRGVTDTPGNRHDKLAASGHRSESMLDVYDLSRPVVRPSDSS